MKLLLDTNIFLWWANEPERLPRHLCSLLENGDDTLLLSLVSVWEIQIKLQLGKLTVTPSLESVLADQQSQNGIELLPIHFSHILALGSIPLHHRDPFDRLLIAQALNENATLVSSDAAFCQYPVQLLS